MTPLRTEVRKPTDSFLDNVLAENSGWTAHRNATTAPASGLYAPRIQGAAARTARWRLP